MKRTCATNRLTARWVLLFLFAAACVPLSPIGARALWAGADETKKEVESAP